MERMHSVGVGAILVAAMLPSLGLAESRQPAGPLTLEPSVITAAQAADAGDRYFFNLLDRRSVYGKGWFPEHFRQTSLDAEREVRLDYFHGEKRGKVEHEIEGEIEWNVVGQLTLTIEAEWESERSISFESGAAEREREEGFSNVYLKAHHPLYQYVSRDGKLDYTLVGKLSIGLPLINDARHDTYEVEPLLGQMLRLGDHFSVQTWTSVDFLIGPKEGGNHVFKYGALLGYRIGREQLPLPGVQSVTPLLELDGRTGIAGEGRGHNQLFGVAGFRLNLDAIGPVQPRIGLGYQFPLDKGARDDLQWGVIASFIMEF